MSGKRISEIHIKPMENYEAPKLPMLDEVNENSFPLKKLPKRWAKNAAIMLGIGVLGLGTLSGCDVINSITGDGTAVVNRGEPFAEYGEFELIVRLHGGGGGWSSYVVYLTEQEILNTIRRRLEAVGLRFNYEPPVYTVFGDIGIPPIGLHLFDEMKNVAISYVSFDDNNRQFVHRIDHMVADRFAEQTDIKVGVISQSHFFIRSGGHFLNRTPPLTEQERETAKIEARPELEEQLNEQIDNFITVLSEAGIIN